MKKSIIFFLLLFPLLCISQKDSVNYFLKQLKRDDLVDSIRVSFYNRVGEYYAEHNIPLALRYFSRAQVLSREIGSVNLLYAASKNLAGIFSVMGNYDSSFFYADKALLYGQDLNVPEYIFTALNQKGNACIKKEQLALAKENFDAAMALVVKTPAIPHASRIYLGMGNYYLAILNFKKSVELLKQGEASARLETEPDDLMRIYSSLGQSLAYTGNADSGLHYQLTALDYFVKNNKVRDEAITLNRIGVVYGLTNNTTKMEEYNEQAYRIYKSTGDNVSAVNTMMTKVNFYFRSFQFDKCLKALNEAEPESARYNLKEHLALSYIYRAGIFSLIKDTANAAKYQRLAENLSKELKFTSFSRMNTMIKSVVGSARDKSSKGDSMVNRSLLAVKNEIPAKLMEASLQSIAINKDLLKDNHMDFVNTAIIINQQDSLGASNYYDSLISQPLDSNMNAVTGKQLLELETKYQNRQKADSILLQQQLLHLRDKEKKRLWAGIGTLGVFALLIIGLLILVSTQKRRTAREKKAVVNLTGILKHETSRQFGELKTSIIKILRTDDPKQQVSKALTLVKTYEMLYSNLFISDGLATISLKGAFEKIFEYHCENNVSVLRPAFNVDGGEYIVFNKSDYLFQYINELMANSFEHAFAGLENPAIHISVKYEKPWYEIIYRDNGCGFSEENQEVIQGKGMYYIHAYATQNLNGRLEINTGEGSEFKLRFNENNI
jgi:two-component sensor histidine kinase